MKRVIIIVLLAAICLACDTNRVFEDVRNFNDAYWLADSIKYFDFRINSEVQEYNILMSLRNGSEYPHSNIYIKYAILDSSSTVIDEELRNFQLFHQKTGYPFGNGSGNIFEHQFDLLIGYQFPEPGRYRIRFEQYMRYDSLPELYSVGVRIETTEP